MTTLPTPDSPRDLTDEEFDTARAAASEELAGFVPGERTSLFPIDDDVITTRAAEKPNAHDIAERFTAMLRRLRSRAEAHSVSVDLADIDFRRRVYRAARRVEEARLRRGDRQPYPADGGTL